VASVNPCRVCGWLTTKPASFPKPSRLSGRLNATSSGDAVRQFAVAREEKGRLLEAARANLGGVEVVDGTTLARGAPPLL
jgi:hypothetical protein